MLIRKVEFIKLLNLSKPGARGSSIFVEPLHLANYQIHRTSEFIEISNSWKPQIHQTLGPLLRVHRSPTNHCEVLTFSKRRTRPNTRQDQPRPQGLLLDDFQDGGSSVEDPGTQRTKTIADWCIILRIHTRALIGLFLPKQKWWLPRFFVEIENRV